MLCLAVQARATLFTRTFCVRVCGRPPAAGLLQIGSSVQTGAMASRVLDTLADTLGEVSQAGGVVTLEDMVDLLEV